MLHGEASSQGWMGMNEKVMKILEDICVGITCYVILQIFQSEKRYIFPYSFFNKKLIVTGETVFMVF